MALPLEKPPTFDAEAYLAWEELQAEKHEYINGEVFAMVGVRQSHGKDFTIDVFMFFCLQLLPSQIGFGGVAGRKT